MFSSFRVCNINNITSALGDGDLIGGVVAIAEIGGACTLVLARGGCGVAFVTTELQKVALATVRKNNNNNDDEADHLDTHAQKNVDNEKSEINTYICI